MNHNPIRLNKNAIQFNEKAIKCIQVQLYSIKMQLNGQKCKFHCIENSIKWRKMHFNESNPIRLNKNAIQWKGN